ncbi:MAG: bifunctional aldolase/short-chain dehydrogenase [Thermodesulfobacteriota bacterium]|nr:bifunctional aldolase/short-chain dehydrogenase [Thermodesulfobacteriota bacterium]
MDNETTKKETMRTYTGPPHNLPEALAMRLYTSRLIGSNTDLVIHGGGNTSVKLTMADIFGNDQDVLFVKGSGVNMAQMGPEGFVAMDMSGLLQLRALSSISNTEMANQLARHKLHTEAPAPSVEVLLHAFLPHKFIDHTHADAILALTNRENAAETVKTALGPGVCVIPYENSGLPLARAAAEAWEADPDTDAIVVLHHGIFTFADDARTAYGRMTECVEKAGTWLRENATPPAEPPLTHCTDAACAGLAQVIRGACASFDVPGRQQRFYVDIRRDEDLLSAASSPAARQICDTGVLTPDHAIRTKNRYALIDHIPNTDEALAALVTETVAEYRADYEAYFSRHNDRQDRTMLDPSPRVFLAAGAGLMGLGETRKAARIAADIATHTVRTKYRNGLSAYKPVDESHIFEMEYWPFQLQKRQTRSPLPLAGQTALVTGAAGAIGMGVADRLIAAGAAVAISDIDEKGLETVRDRLSEQYGPDFVESVVFDITDETSVADGMIQASLKLGGLDIVVPNAGSAYVARIEDLSTKDFNRVIAINLMGTFNTIKAAIPVFRRQNTGGNIVVISTKNVFDPGAAFGAYSASKAGAHQISKIGAMELAEMGVRVNMVNPDAVFGDADVPSKLWEMIGPERMKARGLDPEGLKAYYRERNLLKTSVYPEHVGNAVVFFASDLTPTTGATIPVDGGVPAAFPR